jgi:hypothetical protein
MPRVELRGIGVEPCEGVALVAAAPLVCGLLLGPAGEDENGAVSVYGRPSGRVLPSFRLEGGVLYAGRAGR